MAVDPPVPLPAALHVASGRRDANDLRTRRFAITPCSVN
jgi:hypothetical protein